LAGGTPTTPGTPTGPTSPTSPTGPSTPTPPTLPVELPSTPGGADPVTTAAVATNLVTTFLEKFEIALQNQIDNKPGKDKDRDGLVIEGEVCPR